ncbi:hypothetical protein, conserved [Eimeria tenella]|uniref:Fcf2 pre-rRNA processing C-terminal domain-containing protein n=1 Tax=Eimeria tenella TaxID=5802 RepID=U6KVY8_EIMTE|nr:hypothetical protein, conserved [Eimeria tenella]CDJ41088.1 hypothetical protein, conserved [Eimeria tenella]|eukprot:XP_013231838.1 hypothetical protein, conserved [Eimeria tenella]
MGRNIAAGKATEGQAPTESGAESDISCIITSSCDGGSKSNESSNSVSDSRRTRGAKGIRDAASGCSDTTTVVAGNSRSSMLRRNRTSFKDLPCDSKESNASPKENSTVSSTPSGDWGCNGSDRNRSRGDSNNISSRNKVQLLRPVALATPRISLSFLHSTSLLKASSHSPPPVPISAQGANEQKSSSSAQPAETVGNPLPPAFSHLSLGRQAPTPLLKPLNTPSGPLADDRVFLDTTAAPGVVSLQPLEPTRACVLLSSSNKTLNVPGERDERKVAEAVAAGGLPLSMASVAMQQKRPVSGASLICTDISVLQKAEKERRRVAEKQQLRQWFNMPLTEISPQMQRELKALQLWAHANSKTFSGRNREPVVPVVKQKGNSSGFPIHAAYMAVARVVGGGLRGVGGGLESQAAGTANKGPRGRGGASSVLQEMLSDPNVAKWTRKKCREIRQNNANRITKVVPRRHKRHKK